MSGQLEIHPTPLDGPKLIARKPVGDERGFLERLFCQSELSKMGVDMSIRQINRTLTCKQGTVRGLHFQYPPSAEIKIITCLTGRVFDVAVDLRAMSPEFGRWFGVELSGEEHNSYLIPRGFAHGFQTMTADCEMLYLHSHDYAPVDEGGINPQDSSLSIDWPEKITAMSDRDNKLPGLTSGFSGITL